MFIIFKIKKKCYIFFIFEIKIKCVIYGNFHIGNLFTNFNLKNMYIKLVIYRNTTNKLG